MNKILIYNSNKFSGGIIKLLEKIFYGLSDNNKIFYYGSEKHSAESKTVSKTNYKKYNPKLLINKNSFLIFLFSPILFIKFFIQILKWRIIGVKKIICFGLTEKIFTFIPAKIFGIKLYWIEWEILNFFNKKSLFRFLYKLYSKKIIIITVADKIKQQLVKIKIEENNIHTIPAGIEINKFSQKTIVNQFSNGDLFRIGTICQLEKNKGIEQLMQAVKITQGFIPNLRLTIVGDGNEKKNLIWLAKKLEITEITQFSGFQSDTNSWINSFAIFIFPILSNKAFSLTILQAMAYGKAVITFNVGALSEQVEDTKSGLLIKKEDVNEMAQVIIDLHRHQDYLQKMGEYGKQIVTNKFDLAKIIQQWQKIIQ